MTETAWTPSDLVRQGEAEEIMISTRRDEGHCRASCRPGPSPPPCGSTPQPPTVHPTTKGSSDDRGTEHRLDRWAERVR